MKNHLFLTMVLFTICYNLNAQVKTYIKTRSGEITYYDEVLEGIPGKIGKKLHPSLGYTGVLKGNSTQVPMHEISSVVSVKTVRKKLEYTQVIYLPINWTVKKIKINNVDGMWSYDIDSSAVLSKCFVRFAKGDTLYIRALIQEGSPTDVNYPNNPNSNVVGPTHHAPGGSPDAYSNLVLIGNKLYYVGLYGKKKKTLEAKKVLIKAFADLPDYHDIAKELLETGTYQTKKTAAINQQIISLYFDKYFIEL